MNDVLRLANIEKRYKRTCVLKIDNLQIGRGEVCGLVGVNGAGKSTLIRVINGLSLPTAGSIELFGVSDVRLQNKLRRKVGYMPDASASYPYLSVRDNLFARALEWGIADDQIEQLIKEVGLVDASDSRASKLSMGQRRRLDLATALLGEPELLIMDEPTNGLDPLGVRLLRCAIKSAAARGAAVLVSSHNLEELHKLATRYLFLGGGRIIRSISSADLEAACHCSILLNLTDWDSFRSVLSHRRLGMACVFDGIDRVFIENPLLPVADILARLKDANCTVTSLEVVERDLEGYYVDLLSMVESGGGVFEWSD